MREEYEENKEKAGDAKSGYWIGFALLLIAVYVVLSSLVPKSPDKARLPNARVIKSGDYLIDVVLLEAKNIKDLQAQPYAEAIIREYSKGLPSDDAALRIAAVRSLLLNDREGAEQAIEKIPGKQIWSQIIGSGKFNIKYREQYLRAVEQANLGSLKLPVMASVYYRCQDKAAGDLAMLRARDQAAGRVAVVAAAAIVGMVLCAAGVAFLVLGIRNLKHLPPFNVEVFDVMVFLRYLVAFGLTSYIMASVLGGRAKIPVYYSISLLVVQLAALSQFAISGIAKAFDFRSIDMVQIGQGVAGACAALPIHVCASLLSYSLFRNSLPQDTLGPYITAGGFAGVMMIVVIVFIGPFVEELAFRGALMDSLLKKMEFWPAAVVCSAAFAAMHLDFAFKFVPIFCFAMILCYLRRKTGSLTASYIAHVINNALVVSLLFVY